MPVLPSLRLEPLPRIDLRHFLTLTDDTGILQHASYATPDLQHGYCTDDVARALIVAVMAVDLRPKPATPGGDNGNPNADLLIPIQRYLAFLDYAFNEQYTRFRNFMSFDRTWLEEVGSEDSHARALWSLGVAVRLAPNESVRDKADSLYRRALGGIEGAAFIRPWAYGLVAADEHLDAGSDPQRDRDIIEHLGARLFTAWRDHAEPDWPWWEDTLTWGNAKLPHSLLLAANRTGNDAWRQAALESLDWLVRAQTRDGHLSIIGNEGWFTRGRPMAQWDQQPIEAKSLVQACLAAARATGEQRWIDHAEMAFAWFTGENDIGEPLYNPQTGGGHDGLTPVGLNANQGAESTIAYVLSALELHAYHRATNET